MIPAVIVMEMVERRQKLVEAGRRLEVQLRKVAAGVEGYTNGTDSGSAAVDVEPRGMLGAAGYPRRVRKVAFVQRSTGGW